MNPLPHFLRPLLLGCTLVTASSTFAQPGRPLAAGDQQTRVVVTAISRSAADIDGGGDFSSTDYTIEAGSQWGLGNGRSIGASLKYQLLDYDFSAAAGGWSEIERIDLGLSFAYPLSRTSALFAAPSIGSGAESGASSSDALNYGAILGYTRQVDESLTVGVGAGLFFGLEDTSGFPVVFVRWQINQDWRLGNPFRPGPAGPAGIELAYTGLDNLEMGFGASYRTQRFKLDDSLPGSASYGEERGAALFVRATRTIGPTTHLDLYAGTVVGGELTWDDANGRTLSRRDNDPSLVLAPAFSASC